MSEGKALVEVTVRTFQSRLLLRPGPAVNEIILGVLGRAQRLYPVRCCSVVFMSNHWHALLQVDDALQLARFMQHVDGNLSSEIGRKEIHDWPHTMWSRRYQAIVVSDEPAAQIERLRYHLAHGVKEGLVDQMQRWPGVHFARSILGGKPLKGLWFDRTQEYAARNRGEDFGRLKYAEEEELKLSQLPCWADVTPEEYRERIAGLVEEIEAEARADRQARGIEPLGVEAILRQDPHTRPNQTKKSPAPACHAASKEARKRFWEAYSAFVAAFREAAEKLKAGEWPVRFPLGSFPPGLPFISPYPALPP
ncbi:MAG TPA: transposase [Thermoanaerobaculia bacterium]|nr:transposase [Thermoanaerobaculia bacterium]